MLALFVGTGTVGPQGSCATERGWGMGAALSDSATDSAVLSFCSFFSNKRLSVLLQLISRVLKWLFLKVLSSFITAC